MKILSQLSRITTPGRTFIPQIDGLRFVAIMAVIGFHVRAISSYHLLATPMGNAVEGDVVNNVLSVGHLGVELFFAISGFILSLPFARWWLRGEKPVSLRNYYIRRVTRIEPPYVLHLLFLFLFCALVLRRQPAQQHLFEYSNWFDYTWQHLLASLFYLNGLVFGRHPYPNIVLWSLEVEVQFYLMAPLLARAFKIGSAAQRRGLLAATILLLPPVVGQIAAAMNRPYWVDFSLLGNLQYFLVGFLLADWHVTSPAPPVRNFGWDLAAILGCVVVVVFRHNGWIYAVLPLIIGVGCLAAFCGKLTFRVMGNPWITAVGGMCYTIYMYHWLMISALIRPLVHMQTHILWLDLLIYAALMTAVIVPVCAVLFVLCERPFMRREWPAQFWAAIFANRHTAPK